MTFRPAARAWAMAAAVVLLVGVGGWSILLQRDAAETQHRLALLQGALAAQARPDAQVAQLVGTEDAASARGYAVISPADPGYIVVAGLPVPSVGQVWQAWYLTEGAPESAGLLKLGPDGLATLEGINPVPGTVGFALTLEPAGGSRAPTTTPVVAGALVAT